jgi:hypothetical protein
VKVKRRREGTLIRRCKASGTFSRRAGRWRQGIEAPSPASQSLGNEESDLLDRTS